MVPARDREIMKDFEGDSAEFNTCGFQQKLPDMKSLARKCNCPKYFKHEPLIGKEKTARAAEYPAELCLEFAKLLIRNFRTVLELEWWRHQQKEKRENLNEVRERWAASKERALISKPVIEQAMKEMRGYKRAWDAEGTCCRLQTDRQKGPTGNPTLAIRRLAVLGEAGKDVARLWHNLTRTDAS